MTKRDVRTVRAPWIRPCVRRIGGRSAQFSGEVNEDGDGLS